MDHQVTILLLVNRKLLKMMMMTMNMIMMKIQNLLFGPNPHLGILTTPVKVMPENAENIVNFFKNFPIHGFCLIFQIKTPIPMEILDTVVIMKILMPTRIQMTLMIFTIEINGRPLKYTFF